MKTKMKPDVIITDEPAKPRSLIEPSVLTKALARVIGFMHRRPHAASIGIDFMKQQERWRKEGRVWKVWRDIGKPKSEPSPEKDQHLNVLTRNSRGLLDDEPFQSPKENGK